MNRKQNQSWPALLATLVLGACSAIAAGARPNFIVFLVDDVGYNDINCFGGTRAPTPNLNQMAQDGMRFTNFYVQPVCGVTRAALMTGCYPMRIGERKNGKHAHPIMHPEEVTMAEVLKEAGYQTALIGKWHLAGGGQPPPEWMPNGQGFDYYFGTPTHNGTTREISKFPTGLMRDGELIDTFIDQEEMDQLTTRYTDEATQFIREHKEEPFFLYLAHNMAHVVLGVSDKFRGKTDGGLYGDVMAELDWSAGEVMKTLKECGIDENTLMIFTSDNGPWIEHHLTGQGGIDTHYGSAAPFRGSKIMTWEGGVRVPTIVRWPGSIPADTTCDVPVTIMDLMPTFAKLGDGNLPEDRIIDGKDIGPLLRNEPDATPPHETIFYYSYTHLHAVRSGKWKLVAPRPATPPWSSWYGRMIEEIKAYELYDLEAEEFEGTNVASSHPEVVVRLKEHLEKAREDLGDYDRIGKGARFFDEIPPRQDVARWAHSEPRPPPASDKPKRSVSHYDHFPPVGDLRFTFEEGKLDGWNVVEGAFHALLSKAESLPKWARAPFGKEGSFHLTTTDAADGVNDVQTGVIESPRFIIKGNRAAFLASGGENMKTLYVALCDAETGEALFKAGGPSGSRMHRVVWKLDDYAGREVFLRIVDRETKNWGHLTFDDFSIDGVLKP